MKKLNHLSVIVVYGPAGSGKTTLADFLHKELENVAHIGVDHVKRFISEFREVPSHQEISKKVIRAMLIEYLKNDISVIIDQGMDTSELEAIRNIADEYKTKYFVYRLEADRSILNDRIFDRMKKLGKPMVSKEILDNLFKIYKETVYSDTAVFNSGDINTRDIAGHILKGIAS